VKKVRIAAGGILPLVGLFAGAMAAPAYAATGTLPAVPPPTGQGCVEFGSACTLVDGSGLHVKYIRTFDHGVFSPNNRTAYVGYKNAAGFAPKSKWKTATMHIHAVSGVSSLSFQWNTNQCDVPNGTSIYTWAVGNPHSKPVVGVHGSDYLKSKACI
jgi:hypothetical protein